MRQSSPSTFRARAISRIVSQKFRVLESLSDDNIGGLHLISASGKIPQDHVDILPGHIDPDITPGRRVEQRAIRATKSWLPRSRIMISHPGATRDIRDEGSHLIE
jgi:hypothetical protein